MKLLEVIANWELIAMGARKLEKYLTRQFEQQVARTNVEREQKYRVADIRPIRPRADQVPFIQ